MEQVHFNEIQDGDSAIKIAANTIRHFVFKKITTKGKKLSFFCLFSAFIGFEIMFEKKSNNFFFP